MIPLLNPITKTGVLTALVSVALITVTGAMGSAGGALRGRAIVTLGAPNRLPEQVLIGGVPFTGFAEAANLKYADKEVLNPSVPACYSMVIRFWGHDAKILDSKDWAKQLTWAKLEGKSAQSLDDVKPYIARGIPVIVQPAATPYAHYLNPPVAAMLAFTGAKSVDLNALEKVDGSTGVLGRMLSFENFRKIKIDGLKKPIRESVYASSRVVVGYDDRRRIVTLHDPSFGPAWELGYDDFDAMWEPMDREYTALFPKDYEDTVGRPSASPYRDRTPSEKAACNFVFGYALSAIGRTKDAESMLKVGAEMTEAGKGYQHLFLLELASIDVRDRRFEQAAGRVEAAVLLIPENPVAWRLLSQIYTDWQGHADKANEASRKADSARSKRGAINTLADVFPRNIWIQTLGGIRGWAGELKRSGS